MKRWKKLLLVLLFVALLSQVPFAYRRYKLGRLHAAIQQVNSHRQSEEKSNFVEFKGVMHVHLLLPPWESARVVQPAKISEVGSEAIVETRIFGPINMRWVARHTVYDPPHLFEDVQLKGPFHSWRHRHVVEPHNDGAILRDEIDFEPPLGFLGRAVAPFFVQKRLQELFDYRHEVTRQWCERREG